MFSNFRSPIFALLGLICWIVAPLPSVSAAPRTISLHGTLHTTNSNPLTLAGGVSGLGKVEATQEDGCFWNLATSTVGTLFLDCHAGSFDRHGNLVVEYTVIPAPGPFQDVRGQVFFTFHRNNAAVVFVTGTLMLPG